MHAAEKETAKGELDGSIGDRVVAARIKDVSKTKTKGKVKEERVSVVETNASVMEVVFKVEPLM